MKIKNKKYGFTLMELMVVLLIIAILAAIAVPQYKKATLKARFSTVMPMAKSIADAQEVYYQGRQLYALDVDELDVTPVTAENTSVTLSQTDGYDYVMAQNSKVPGANYIIYQKYSENYPSEIHCEAEDDNDDAQWLCSTLSQNNSIGQTITAGYTTYIINGTGAGVVPGTFEQVEEASNRMSCDKAIEMGFTCTSDETTGVKKICQNGICRTKTYNEDGSYTSVTCQANSEGVCTSDWRSVTYDANGNKLSQRNCSSVDSNGNCTAYSSYSNYDYLYDENGTMISRRWCGSVSADGSCVYANNAYGYNRDYIHDSDGNLVAERQCSNLAADGGCSTYYSAGYVYTYDTNGNKTSQKYCTSLASDGSCSSYSAGPNYDESKEYTYDANGHMISERTCLTVTSDGRCSTYNGGYAWYYTYDANGNPQVKYGCSSFTEDGSCSTYSSQSSYFYTTDDKGSITGYKVCSGNDLSPAGECSRYREQYTQPG